MNNIRVRVLDVTHVQPEQQTTDQPRDHDATIKLSPFDTFFLALPPIQRLYLYDDDGDGTSLPPFPSLVSSLRASLAATLAVFTLLAGKLTACSHDNVFIDCSPDAVHPGVRFVEAEYSGDAADMRRLARDVEHDTEAFLQLVPELEVGMLPASVLAVQVTRPAPAGGDDSAGVGAVAVGVSMHHAVADGQSLWQFMRAWAAASRDGSPAPAVGLVPPPTFDRAPILQHPKAEAAARVFARLYAPEMPKINMLPEPDWARQSRRTYLLTAGQIQSLKQRILERQAANKNDGNEPPEPPTTYVAIASLLWTSIARAKCVDHANAADDAYFLFPADCRRRLRPPLDPGFFGNCIKVCYARATAGDLVHHGRNGDDALARAAAAVWRAIREHVEEEDPLGDADRWAEINRAVPRERLAKQGSSHRFMAYEVDFGWGQPSRVELVSVFSGEMATLVGARGGAVQVSVALGREHMDGFEASFLSQVSA